jgi:hypothetical protein
VPSEPSPPRPPSPYPADTTLRSLLDDLAAEGFTGQFVVDPEGDGVTCATCSAAASADDLRYEQRRRIEGASDPAEMSDLLAATCPACDARGVIICRYGPEAGPGDSAVLGAARGQLEP